MFASPQTPFRQTGHYTPSKPSPLNISTPPWTMSPTRNSSNPPFALFQTEPVNRHTQNHTSPIPLNMNFSMDPNTSTQSPNTGSPTRPKPKYEARYASTIANPLKNSGLARSKTRRMFLNRVRNDRDEGRFEARGEQMMHMEHLADRRKWEESMAREGEIVEPDIADEDDMLPDDGDVLDEFLSQEEAMEMALRETQMRAQTQAHGRVDQLRGNGSGNDVPYSDDDDYDDIFMRLQEQSQDMDMS
ncbi:unnamed protein product [Penicillium salamii]|uniref:Uncharacterized protein n=1 Tax=Penicillium salamii TaxID=1612424 RepID=A0A9W4IKI1_9EURO|nr:unnamed protein product [Penicillium salamii]CAG8235443.1 unnamed protein product [Penicillium salamii]CAG8291935.1 unnamed protein product [Penicillium salamii]CAG8293819.1 unnamed protein product [Penicillium salamii]CAG8400066.1 unnamed protein product [Penicillium salamii]